MGNKKATETVEEISKINFSGNIIPQNWFKFIKFPSGKPDLLGVMILSEVIYWYRASEVRDEATGQMVGQERKFKADKLQRNYQSFADQFGVSKRQVQEAIRRLKEAGIITIELRTITLDSGMVLNNESVLKWKQLRKNRSHNSYINLGISDNYLNKHRLRSKTTFQGFYKLTTGATSPCG
ncbi:MAG: GntR family transcriptional regulator [Syntrophomonadaceae bacterium]|nr:GntR family transcriptional regulator [Syntrophomonadaceae bacterium]